MAGQIAIGLAMAFPCVLLRTAGMAGLFYWTEWAWQSVLRRFELFRNSFMLSRVFLGLLALHFIEMTLWAGLYWVLHCFESFETALYYSASAYTTVGYGDVVLPKAWRLVGSIETCTGMLMFGWSTGFFWAVSHLFLSERHRRLVLQESVGPTGTDIAVTPDFI